jgi:hypothetical protein
MGGGGEAALDFLVAGAGDFIDGDGVWAVASTNDADTAPQITNIVSAKPVSRQRIILFGGGSLHTAIH